MSQDFIVDLPLAMAECMNERRLKRDFHFQRRVRPMHAIFRLAGLGCH